MDLPADKTLYAQYMIYWHMTDKDPIKELRAD